MGASLDLINKYPSLYSAVRCGVWVPAGWYNLLCALSDDLIRTGKPIVVEQVKEKFGGLRFYVESSDDEIDKLIRQAEDLSYTVCQDCGEKGELRKEGWLITLCDSCHVTWKRTRGK